MADPARFLGRHDSMHNKHVVFLPSERAWKRWIKTVDGATYKDYNKSETRPSLIISVAAPTEYPCWAYARMQSYGDEEEAPEYLYREDLIAMLDKIENWHRKDLEKFVSALYSSDE
jgi:hypothetical protein